MDDYFAAKMRLFDTLLQPGQTAVIDADSDAAPRVSQACKARGLALFTVGSTGETIVLKEARAHALATSLKLGYAGADFDALSNFPVSSYCDLLNRTVYQ